MISVVLVTLSLLVYVSGFQKLNFSYHDTIGIPAGKRMKETEDRILSLPSPRIIGGNFAALGAHPYLAGLIASFNPDIGNSVCGASLLSPNRLVTAGHCWYDGRRQPALFTVVLGSRFLFSGGLRIPTSMVVVNPNYIPGVLDNDIAMIALPTNVQYSPYIRPVNLPHNMLSESFTGEVAVAAGFGKTSDRQTFVSTDTTVQEVRLRVMSVPDCQRWFVLGLVKPSHICTSGEGHVGICSGDSGGPLVTYRGDPILIGVTSFNSDHGCEIGVPSAFTRVTSFYNFIMANM